MKTLRPFILFMFIINLCNGQSPTVTKVTDSLDYSLLDELPSFAGDDSAFADYIKKSFVYSKDLRDEGVSASTLRVGFTIDKEGKLINDSILAYDPLALISKSINSYRGKRGNEFENHLLEILEASPKWKPGKYKARTQ